MAERTQGNNLQYHLHHKQTGKKGIWKRLQPWPLEQPNAEQYEVVFKKMVFLYANFLLISDKTKLEKGYDATCRRHLLTSNCA